MSHGFLMDCAPGGSCLAWLRLRHGSSAAHGHQRRACTAPPFELQLRTYRRSGEWARLRSELGAGTTRCRRVRPRSLALRTLFIGGLAATGSIPYLSSVAPLSNPRQLRTILCGKERKSTKAVPAHTPRPRHEHNIWFGAVGAPLTLVSPRAVTLMRLDLSITDLREHQPRLGFFVEWY